MSRPSTFTSSYCQDTTNAEEFLLITVLVIVAKDDTKYPQSSYTELGNLDRAFVECFYLTILTSVYIIVSLKPKPGTYPGPRGFS